MENTQLQGMQQQDTLVEKLVQVNRVAKTVKGGRVMSFTALTVSLPLRCAFLILVKRSAIGSVIILPA